MDTRSFPTHINCKGRLLDLNKPVVMGILNVTPDSFFDGGQLGSIDQVLKQAETMLSEGASILDIGGASSRPGAKTVSEQEEQKRVLPAIQAICREFPNALLSIDTWRASVAREAVSSGACIVNDISAGSLDSLMYKTVADLNCPYILMHMQGTPQTMQVEPQYQNVVQDVLDFMITEVQKLRELDIQDILIDPGFGFGKSVSHNYQILNKLEVFSSVLKLPVLAGLSRKSMICKVLNVNPEKALNGTTALHMIALQQGAKVLRVHDVRPAMETIRLWQEVEANQ